MAIFKYYTLRYWIQETSSFTSKLDSSQLKNLIFEKNTYFVDTFFKDIEISITGTKYTILIQHMDDSFILGKLAKKTKQVNYENQPDKHDIVKKKIDNNPFVSFFVDKRHKHQYMYIGKNPLVYSGLKAITRILEIMVMDILKQQLIVKFKPISFDSIFWKEIRNLMIVKKIKFIINADNFLDTEDEIVKLANKIKEYNGNVYESVIKSDTSIVIPENDSSINSQVEYAEQYSGDWVISGQTQNGSSQTIKFSDKVKAEHLEIDQKVIDNPEEFFKCLEERFTRHEISS